MISKSNKYQEIEWDEKYHLNCWLACFDLLGTKEKIKKEGAEYMFRLYTAAIDKAKDLKTAWDKISYIGVSDSFILYSRDDSLESFEAIDNICHNLYSFLIVNKEIPVRGAIAFGEFYCDSSNELFFGKALVEAYEYGETQDWINFILCPSADKKYKEYKRKNYKWNYALTEIPFKNCNSQLPQSLPAHLPYEVTFAIDALIKMRSDPDNLKAINKYNRTIEFFLANKH